MRSGHRIAFLMISRFLTIATFIWRQRVAHERTPPQDGFNALVELMDGFLHLRGHGRQVHWWRE